MCIRDRLANKCDLASEGFLGNVSQLDDYCKDKGFVGWFETSAKENIGIDEAARCLVAKILENDESIEQQSSDKDVVTVTQQEANPKKSGCC